MNKTVREVINAMRRRLVPLYGKGETQAIIRIIFNYLKGWNTTDMFMHSDMLVSALTLNNINKIMERLERHEPIQYITGIAPFYGMDFMVNRNVLIPRPETEELVDIIVKRNSGRNDLRILDVATGSGCIAIALSRNLPFSQVTALDVSADAIGVARDNAKKLRAAVSFLCVDVFEWESQPARYDIMVSNPPYIDVSERAAMDANVLEYEPEQALFVPDGESLVFYSRIADLAMEGLCGAGRLYFEINPRHSSEVAAMLRNAGMIDVEIIRDISGKERFALAQKPGDDD